MTWAGRSQQDLARGPAVPVTQATAGTTLFGVNWGQPAGVAAPASCRERLGVLAAYAAVLLALAAWRLRRVLSG
jgi:hypothetical protein